MPGKKTVQKPGVALFIDLENIRVGFQYKGLEPNLQELVEKAKDRGPLIASFAYADFKTIPEWMRVELGVMGVTIRDTPMRRYSTPDGERVKNVTDMHMILDIVETALDRANIETYVVGTGDSDFLRIVTMLRNRFEKKVVVIGVPGGISWELSEAATESEPMRVSGEGEVLSDDPTLVGLVRLMHFKKPPTGDWTVRQILQWARQPHNLVPGDASRQFYVLRFMIDNDLVRQEMVSISEGRETRVSFLNIEHETVQRILGSEGPVVGNGNGQVASSK